MAEQRANEQVIKQEKMEIKAAEYVKTRLLRIKELAQARRQKKADKIMERAAELSEYKTEDEALEAYGWGFITQSEYESICDKFAGAEEKGMADDVDLYVINWINSFIEQLNGQISLSKFELMTPEERKAYWETQDELDRLKERKGAK